MFPETVYREDDLDFLFSELDNIATYVTVSSEYINCIYKARFIFVYSNQNILEFCRLDAPASYYSVIRNAVRDRLSNLDMYSETRVIYVRKNGGRR